MHILKDPSPTTDQREWWARKSASAALLLALVVVVLYFRRPDQFFSPYIWVEDGTVSLKQYLEHGWRYLGEPVAGYLILPSKLIQLAALWISGLYYPELAMIGTIVFTWLVLCCIAYAPTTLRWKYVCAIAPLVIPTDSEVFGTSHYAFWWGSLLLIPALLWRPDAGKLPLRLTISALGALSSPLVIALLPLFVINALWRRRPSEWILLICMAGGAGLQYYFIKSTGTPGAGLPEHISILAVAQKFLGYFVWWPASGNVALALSGIVLAALLAGAASRWREIQWTHVVLAGAFVVSVVISIARAPVEIIDPFFAGPRYFFYPYILLSWTLLQVASISHRIFAGVLLSLLLASTQAFGAHAPRGHHPMDWRLELAECAASRGDEYLLPIHFAGHRDQLWHFKIRPSDCARLISQGAFARSRS
ncbi:hypothetical protein [Luteimonas huabeiensis]|uniref:hypothetical protein n=1 Tax=Luteimonas huabeiensis TaxID=1244513 RepID=UPI0004B7A978|nr:hypothetical protein [Luteimonas huabeiensis]